MSLRTTGPGLATMRMQVMFAEGLCVAREEGLQLGTGGAEGHLSAWAGANAIRREDADAVQDELHHFDERSVAEPRRQLCEGDGLCGCRGHAKLLAIGGQLVRAVPLHHRCGGDLLRGVLP